MKHYLDEPVLTRYIRFEVVSFSGPHQCMRVEIYGCSPGYNRLFFICIFIDELFISQWYIYGKNVFIRDLSVLKK